MMTRGRSAPIIYLDNSATMRPLPEVVATVTETLQNDYANPSSLHEFGLSAERILTSTRNELAKFLGTESHKIFFTSGATEANNTILRGVAAAYSSRGRHIITTPIEHPSVLATCQYLETGGFEIDYLPVDDKGTIHPDDLSAKLRNDTILISIMAVNNEVGTIQPITEVALRLDALGSRRPFFHTDAVQAIGKIPVDLSRITIDGLSLSGHKFGAPKGVGIMFLNSPAALPPLLYGGGQEDGMRSGTENTSGIAGIGAAVNWLQQNQRAANEKMYQLRQYLGETLESEIPNCHVNGPPADAPIETVAPHILNVSFPTIPGEILVHSLAESSIYVSTGTACSSKAETTSRVLSAMGLAPELARSSIRVSFSYETSAHDIDALIDALNSTVPHLRRMTRYQQ